MAGLRFATRVVNVLIVTAVLLVVFVNLSWHHSQYTAVVAEQPRDVTIAGERLMDSSAEDVMQQMDQASRPGLDKLATSVREAAPVVEEKIIPAAEHEESAGERIHAVTYASHGGRDDRFCRAVESALRHDIDLVVLGWGVPWKGLSQKLAASHAYAAALPADDVMLFTDAFDVMFTNSSKNILGIFEGMNANILFAGECGCWPHVMEDHGRPCFKDYPIAPTPYRYLNSGTWIAKAGPAADMLLAVISEAGKNFANANDQKLVADMYMQGRFGIKLDFYSQIFQSMHMTLSKPLPMCNPTTDVRITGGHFYNGLTHTYPSVFHFNGGGKSVHLQMESSIWYKRPQFNTPESREALASRLISVPVEDNLDRRIKFNEMCPDYFNPRSKMNRRSQ